MVKVQARLDADGTVRTRRRGGSWERPRPQIDWARVDATTEAEIAQQAAEDEAEAAKDAALWARRVRRRTGFSQAEFARRIGVSVATVRNWERGKELPDGAARALLRILDRMPKAALVALAAQKPLRA